MPFRTFGPVPFPPLAVIDRDEPIDADWIINAMADRGGSVSLLLRTTVGVDGRGGFFFHLSQNGELLKFHDFAGDGIIDLPGDTAAKLINHASGRMFDPEVLTLCQRVINLRQDA
jgi:hypothetical protein